MSISHPAWAAGLMLRHKEIEARRIEIPPGSQQLRMRAAGFRHGTVPGLKLNGRRIQGTLQISRALEEAKPNPPLFPDDPAKRAAVEEAERWGDRTYQPVPRRIFRWVAANDDRVRQFLARQMALPAPALASKLMLPVAHVYMRFEGGGETQARRDLAELPGHLDHVEELLAAGTIGGDRLSAADFQIATTTRVLLNFPQLRPVLEGRPAAEHATRIAPRLGNVLSVELPDGWIPPALR
ncbi:MAG: glutathione S-transferase family protein [Solirubrobacterales bacterium]